MGHRLGLSSLDLHPPGLPGDADYECTVNAQMQSTPAWNGMHSCLAAARELAM
jgi:hypothetical protein